MTQCRRDEQNGKTVQTSPTVTAWIVVDGSSSNSCLSCRRLSAEMNYSSLVHIGAGIDIGPSTSGAWFKWATKPKGRVQRSVRENPNCIACSSTHEVFYLEFARILVACRGGKSKAPVDHSLFASKKIG